MKKLLLAAVFYLSLFFAAMQVEAQPPDTCAEVGTDCGQWTQAGSPFIYHHPSYPNCDIDIYYSFMICDDVTYFRLDAIGMEASEACDEVFDYLVPYGLGTNAWGVRLFEVWQGAYYELTEDWFTGLPNKPNCPNFYTCKSITPGGCISWTYAYAGDIDPSGWPEFIFFKWVPCLDGCCILTKIMCWDNAQQKVEIIMEETVKLFNGSCDDADPLYDPFDGWGQEWTRGPFSDCEEGCYIDN